MSTPSRLPVPPALSEEARRFLAAPPRGPISWPRPDDVAAWEALTGAVEAMMASRGAAVADPDVSVEDRVVAGVRTYVATGPGAPRADAILLDLHPGAFVMGGGPMCRRAAARTARDIGLRTYGVDYRMPPRHPFPAALDDCVAVYRALLAEHDPRTVAVTGKSAGGNLAAALVHRARGEGLPLPAVLVLDMPELDLTESGDSFETLRAYDVVSGGSLMAANELYAGGRDLTDPLLSPLFGDLHGFPPTLLQSGTRDLFLSNTVRMHQRLRAAGVDADLHVYDAMPHGGFGGDTPEDHQAAAERRRFVHRHLSTPH